jgi:hypothetical protein
LLLAAYAQLRLARGIVADRRLPWEKPLPPYSLSPTGYCSFSRPSCPCWERRRGPVTPRKVPGRPKGSRSEPAKRYPAVKKAA